MEKRTLLDVLQEKVDVENELKNRFEIEYRIFILKAEKHLEESLVEIDSLSECKAHKDNVLRWVDFLTPPYTMFSEGDQDDYENVKTYLYSNIERQFFSIFEVNSYKVQMQKQLQNALKKWWNHRESVLKLT